jgi:protein-tyrosine phosphatase
LELEKLQNLAAVVALLGALQNPAVHRHSSHWRSVPRLYLNEYEKIKTIQIPDKSYKNYRERERLVLAQRRPYLPFLGVLLSDITFINFGTKKQLPDGSINTQRLYRLGNVISNGLSFQQKAYDIKYFEEIQIYLRNISKIILPDEDLYSRSRKIPALPEEKKGIFGELLRSQVVTRDRDKLKRYTTLMELGDQELQALWEEAQDLNLTYITEKIIAMGYPIPDRSSRYPIQKASYEEIKAFFDENYPKKYRIYNLTEDTYSEEAFHSVGEYPIRDHGVPPLALVREFCNDVMNWLSMDPDNVAAVHCSDGKGRTGVMISCYLISAGMANTAVDALQKFDWRRTTDGSGVTLPSQRRCVFYWESVVKGGLLKIERPLRISSIIVQDVPLKMGRTMMLCIANAKNNAIYSTTTTLTSLTTTENRVKINLEFALPKDLVVTSDTTVHFLQSSSWRIMFFFAFHPAFIPGTEGNSEVTFRKTEIDGAHRSKLFNPEFRITMKTQILPPNFQLHRNPLTSRTDIAKKDSIEEDSNILPCGAAKCSICGNFKEVLLYSDKNPICFDCEQIQTGRMGRSSFFKVCRSCSLPIRGNSPCSNLNSIFWHKRCFVCSTCSASIGTSDVVYFNAKLICSACISKTAHSNSIDFNVNVLFRGDSPPQEDKFNDEEEVPISSSASTSTSSTTSSHVSWSDNDYSTSSFPKVPQSEADNSVAEKGIDDTRARATGRTVNSKTLSKWESITLPSQRTQTQGPGNMMRSSSSKLSTPRLHGSYVRQGPASVVHSPTTTARTHSKWGTVGPRNNGSSPRGSSILLEESINRAITHGVLSETEDTELTWETLCELLLTFIEKRPEIKSPRSSTHRQPQLLSTRPNTSKYKPRQIQQNRPHRFRSRSYSDPGIPTVNLFTPPIKVPKTAKPKLATNRPNNRHITNSLNELDTVNNMHMNSPTQLSQQQTKIHGLEKDCNELKQKLDKSQKREEELIIRLQLLAKKAREIEENLKEQIKYNKALQDMLDLEKLSS